MRFSILTVALAALFLASSCGRGEPTKEGFISLTSVPGTRMSSGYAAFVPRRTGGACTKSVAGGCEVKECRWSLSDPHLPQESAGVISVKGVPLDAGFVLSYGSAGYEGPAEPVPPLWNGGETLTASATGGAVPAFSGITVTAPSPITVTAPACDLTMQGSTVCSASRSAALPLAWTGGANTSVLATVISGNHEHAVILNCRFDSSPASISAEAMAKLPADADQLSLQLHGSNQTTFVSGDYNITLEARNWDFVAFMKPTE